ncbi:flagellar protein FlbD [Acutalibacter sp. 1XD8-33]|uniref:flagellar FlbD family protein n=1 Tax=Acutalibacter sp. 1XD8-33 TaxID=2320081 RepID=UPI000EA061E4|nr:flagellar FlbD family protein [Acutalibacter sp. 1XD8-33]RKJ42102.1 flagellar protein FlbD [Acutalibacter sp. 1XD8-33]
MIMLTKTSGERFLVNHLQIECIELIPETKIVMMNRDFYLVQETVQDIISRIGDYNAKVQDIHREISVNDNPKPGPAGRTSTQRPGYRR